MIRVESILSEEDHKAFEANCLQDDISMRRKIRRMILDFNEKKKECTYFEEWHHGSSTLRLYGIDHNDVQNQYKQMQLTAQELQDSNKD